MAEPAVQEQAAPFVPTPDIVGNAFARQYYMILQQSPALVHRFYQDMSRLGRPDDGGGPMTSITTMNAIDEKIRSYGSLKTDIKYVDAQESYNGGVIVLVIGSMIMADDSRRDFTQTFFLAPQDKGYFVLNDIFRYLKDDSHPSKKQDDGLAPTTPSPEEITPVQENHISEQSNGEVYNPSENGEVPVEEGEKEEEEEPVAEVVDEAPNESEVVVESNVEVESNVKAEEVPKKSYASIVMKEAPVTTTSPTFSKSVPKMQEQQVPVAPAPSSVAVAPPPSAEMVDDGNNQDPEAEGHSIYIRNLPINASYPQVEEEFKRFGPIKSGGIQIRINKGFCFGFVEFEVASAARSAIEASPITIGGREVVIEEKKSTYSRGNNRGRYPGRGSGFRGEGGRGRGSHAGGRGYGRGESNRNDFGNRSNGRNYQSRGGEGYQRSDRSDRSDHQTGNAAGRVSRGGMSGFGAARAQRVSAQA